MIRPPALQPGDLIGVVTPSSPAHVTSRERYLHGLQTLRTMGFEIVEGPLTARAVHQGYRSGSPIERAQELMALWRRPDVRAIISTISGSNASSLLPELDFEYLRSHPKIFCGYSDVTSLHMAIGRRAGLSTFYGPAVVPSFGEFRAGFDFTRESFLDATLRHRAGSRRLQAPTRWSCKAPRFNDPASRNPGSRTWQDNAGWRALVPGEVRAEVVCANLNTLVALAGTPYFPELEGRLLLIEEMAAPFSRYERNLRQLQLMGVFDRVAGLLVSKPEMPDPEGAPFGAEDLLLEVLGNVRCPVVVDLDCGHTHPMLTLAQGTPLAVTAHPDGVEIEVLAPMVD
jgi:muramoyltetrapeptide carboxypeptidase LdcA involved in peptidoglycan recycling